MIFEWRRFFQHSTVMVMIFAVAGCANLAPRYEIPLMPIPVSWKDDQAMGQWKFYDPSDNLPKGPWWEIFHDDQLNRLQDLALDHNQGLQAAMASVAKARAIARVGGSDFYPSLDLNPDYQRSRTSSNSGASSSGAVSDRYRLPFDMSYEIDVWGRVRNAFDAGVADLEAGVAAYQTVLLTLTADVAQNYFSLRELDKEMEVLNDAIALRQYAYEMVKELVAGGVTSELDYNQAKTELARARAAQLDVERQRRELENALAVLCGQMASGFRLESAPLNIEPPVIPVSVPSVLLERRPDIAQAERQMAAANARVGIARAAFFPVLSLTGRGGYESVSSGNLLEWDSRVWALGPGLAMPVFSGGRNKAGLAAAQADYERTVAEYRGTVIAAVGDVEIALGNLTMTARQADVQDEVVAAARATAELSMSRYKQGLVTFLEAIDAERSRLDAELTATRILNQRLQSSVRLIKALGGSWMSGLGNEQ